jgi:hypothetical protein
MAILFRNSISLDGVSYIELANAVQRGAIHELLSNGYWSPGYPALIALALTISHATPAWELAIVHALDWLIATGAYFAFTWFFLELMRWMRLHYGPTIEDRSVWYPLMAFAYTFLLTVNLDAADTQAWLVHPDILTEGIVFLIAGMCIRLSLPGTRIAHYAPLGVILGAGYAAKAVMFPLGLALLAILTIAPLEQRARWRGPAVALVAFLAVAAPGIASISLAKGRLTFGDSGRLNYLWLENGVPYSILWDEARPERRELAHPLRQILRAPPVFAFDGPIKGTYPLSYDPSYWFDGLKPRFQLSRQLRTVWGNFGFGPRVVHDGESIAALARRWIPVTLGAFVMLFLRMRGFKIDALVRKHLWLFLWPTCAVLTFASLVFFSRYMLGFFVIAAVAFFLSGAAAIGTARAKPVLLVTGLCLFAGNLWTEAKALRSLANPVRFSTTSVVAEFKAMGLKPGDEMAGTGDPLSPAYYYCAKLAGIRFTQMVTGNANQLAKLPGEDVDRVLDALRLRGAKAIFSFGRPGFDNDTGWMRVDGGIYVRRLR